MSALSATSRSQVLSLYKQLLRTGQDVFHEDQRAVQLLRDKIKLEFTNNRSEADPAKIQELMNVAKESEELLRTKIIQAKQVRPNVYQIRKDHFQTCINAKRERCADCTCGAFD